MHELETAGWSVLALQFRITVAPDLLSEHAKTLCVDHQCPSCGAIDRVTVERVVINGTAITHCHCRTCGHSWHPNVVKN